jgi:hypothetical protein
MYEGSCFTNLDEFKRCEWPEKFAFPPRIGDRVESVDGRRELKVVGVTHVTRKIYGSGETSPAIRVELHK